MIWELYEGVLNMRFLVEADTEEKALDKLENHLTGLALEGRLSIDVEHLIKTIRLGGTEKNRGYAYIKPAEIIR